MNRDIDREYEMFSESVRMGVIDGNIEILRDIHAKNYNGTDDNMPDNFEHWLSGFEYQELVDLIRSSIKEDEFHNSIIMDARF